MSTETGAADAKWTGPTSGRSTASRCCAAGDPKAALAGRAPALHAACALPATRLRPMRLLGGTRSAPIRFAILRRHRQPARHRRRRLELSARRSPASLEGSAWRIRAVWADRGVGAVRPGADRARAPRAGAAEQLRIGVAGDDDAGQAAAGCMRLRSCGDRSGPSAFCAVGVKPPRARRREGSGARSGRKAAKGAGAGKSPRC